MELASEERLSELDQAMDEQDDERALALAKELVRDFPEDPEAWLSLALVCVDTEQDETALNALVKLRELGYDEPEQTSPIEALARFGLGHFEQARTLLETAVRLDPESAELWTELAAVREHLGDHRAATAADERAAELDPEGSPVPLQLDEAAFDTYLREAVELLPAALQRLLDEEVPVLVEPFPSRTLVQEGVRPSTLGLFVGADLLQRSVFDPGGPPTTIHLFQRNLERFSHDEEDLVQQIRITLYHEMGHLMGLDEDDLDERDLA